MSWAKLRMVRGMAERRALRRLARRAADKISTNFAQEKPTADDASGCEGRAAEVLSGPAPVEGLVADPSHVAVKARQSRVEYETLSMEQIREAVAAGDMVAKAARVSAAQPPQGRTAARSGSEAEPAKPGHPAESRVSEDIAPAEAGAQIRSKIDITAAPSGMEAAAARWEGKGAAPGRLAQAVPVLCEGKVMCRCGAQGPGQTRGPVPVWFGDKCIEANCELRGRHELST